MPAKPSPTCDKVVVGCVVPLRTLHIVKISSTTGEWRIARYGRGCVWKIYDSSDHYLGMNQNQVYCVGLVNGEKTVLEYSGPWSLKAKVTSRGGWKDLLLSPRRRLPALAPLTLQSGNYSAVCISPCFLISKNWIYLRPKEGYKEKKIIFNMSINQCTWLQRFVRIVHSFNFLCLKDSWPFVASCVVFLRKGTEGNICPVRRNGNYK